MNRAQQTEHNRALVLAAARRVFLARGYHAATLDEIADDAGFSKGVVYSQFTSKADLFLALLEMRIEERAAQNERIVENLAGGHGVATLFREAARIARSEPAWGLLVIEFRVHAARDPELNRRYAAAHERTLEGVAGVFATVYERAGEEPPFPFREMAEFMLAIGAGAELEQAANPRALHGKLVGDLLPRFFSAASSAGIPT